MRNYIVYGLTKNLPMFFIPKIMKEERTEEEIKSKTKTIKIDGKDICDFSYSGIKSAYIRT